MQFSSEPPEQLFISFTINIAMVNLYMQHSNIGHQQLHKLSHSLIQWKVYSTDYQRVCTPRDVLSRIIMCQFCQICRIAELCSWNELCPKTELGRKICYVMWCEITPANCWAWFRVGQSVTIVRNYGWVKLRLHMYQSIPPNFPGSYLGHTVHLAILLPCAVRVSLGILLVQ